MFDLTKILLNDVSVFLDNELQLKGVMVILHLTLVNG